MMTSAYDDITASALNVSAYEDYDDDNVTRYAGRNGTDVVAAGGSDLVTVVATSVVLGFMTLLTIVGECEINYVQMS